MFAVRSGRNANEASASPLSNHSRVSYGASAPHAGAASESAHSALYDTERTTELFCHIVNRWKSLGGWPLATPDETPADDNPQ